MKWISVEDELPEEGLNVLVYLRDSRRIGVAIAYFLSDRWWGGIRSYHKEPFIDAVHECYHVPDVPSRWVTHWMPLPEPPENS